MKNFLSINKLTHGALTGVTIRKVQQDIAEDSLLKELLDKYKNIAQSDLRVSPFRKFIKEQREKGAIPLEKAKQYKKLASLILKAGRESRLL